MNRCLDCEQSGDKCPIHRRILPTSLRGHRKIGRGPAIRNYHGPLSVATSDSHIPTGGLSPSVSPKPPAHESKSSQSTSSSSSVSSSSSSTTKSPTNNRSGGSKWHENPNNLLYLTELMSSSTGSKGAHAILMRIVELAGRIVKADVANFYRLDEHSGELVGVVSKSTSAVKLTCPIVHQRFSLEDSVAGFVAKTGRCINVQDLSSDYRFGSGIESRYDFNVSSVCAVPICAAQGKTVGIVECLNTNSTSIFTDDDEVTLKALAASASTMYQKAATERLVEMRSKQAQALSQLAACVSATSSELGLETVLNKIADASACVVSAQRINLYLVDEETHTLVLSATNPMLSPDNEAKCVAVKIGQGVVGHVALSSTRALISDPQNDWRFSPEFYEYHSADSKVGGQEFDFDRQNVSDDQSFLSPRAVPEGVNIWSILAIPVKDYLGKTVAVIEAINKPKEQGGVFTEEDNSLLGSLAATAASVLRQAQLYEDGLGKRQQQQALLRIIELLSADIGTAMVVPRIIDASYKLVQAERISMFTIESKSLDSRTGETFYGDAPDQKELICIVSKDESMVGRKIPWGQGIVGHVALTLKSLNITDATNDPRHNKDIDAKTGFVTKAILTVPVIDFEGEGVAVIQAVNKVRGDLRQSGAFTSEDVTVLESLAASAGIILQKSKMYHATVHAEKKSRALMNLLKVITPNASGNRASPSKRLRDMVDGIVSVTYDVLDADRVTIYFVEKEKVFSIVSQDTAGWSFPIGQGIAGSVAKKGKALNIADAYDWPGFDKSFDKKTDYRTQSVLCMPVKDYDGKTMAVIQCLNKHASSVRAHSKFTMQASMRLDSRRVGAPAPVSLISTSGSEVAAEMKSDTVTVEKPYAVFDREDQVILGAICEQVSDAIRRCRNAAVEALLEQTDQRASSLIELFVGEGKYTKMRRPDSKVTPLSGSPTEPKKASRISSSSINWPRMKTSTSKIHELQSRDFDVFAYTDEELLSYCMVIFQAMGLLGMFEVPFESMTNFLLQVKENYQDNPFHNWKHGFSVFHFTFLFLHQTDVSGLLTNQDIFGLLVASLTHDIDHPGNTNSFEINSSSEKALVYNDIAVLENHHAATTFRILNEEKHNIFQNIDSKGKKALRKVMIRAILSTDMGVHRDALTELSETKSLDTLEVSNENHRLFLVKTIIHTSDFSGQVFKPDVARQWEARISEEFDNESKRLKELDLPVPPFMENLNEEKIRGLNQTKFIDYVLEPWWKQVDRLFPAMHDCYDQLMISREMWIEQSGDLK